MVRTPAGLSSRGLPLRTSRWTPLGAAMLAPVTWPRALARFPAPPAGAVQSQPRRRPEARRPPEGSARARGGLTAGAPAAERLRHRGQRENQRPAEPAPAARGGLQPRLARSLCAPAPRWDGRSLSGKRGIQYFSINILVHGNVKLGGKNKAQSSVQHSTLHCLPLCCKFFPWIQFKGKIWFKVTSCPLAVP